MSMSINHALRTPDTNDRHRCQLTTHQKDNLLIFSKIIGGAEALFPPPPPPQSLPKYNCPLRSWFLFISCQNSMTRWIYSVYRSSYMLWVRLRTIIRFNVGEFALDEERRLHRFPFEFFHKKKTFSPKCESLNTGCGLSANLYGTLVG